MRMPKKTTQPSDKQDLDKEVTDVPPPNLSGFTPDDGEADDWEDGLTLEELSQVYARIMGPRSNDSPQLFTVSEPEETNSPNQNQEMTLSLTSETNSTDAIGSEDRLIEPFSVQGNQEDDEPAAAVPDQDESWPVTAAGIVEAVLMVGRPDGAAITATEIAGLMRGVTESDVDHLIAELNGEYLTHDRALRIVSVGGGYRMQLAEDLNSIAEAFFGPARQIRLSQSAVDCLALVGYQPGIHRDQLDEQLGKSCGPVLNQLVRRRLLEMRRQKTAGKTTVRYYPTDRLLKLVGLQSFDDLPTAEEWNERQ
jgi:segregation and condensation protein B